MISKRRLAKFGLTPVLAGLAAAAVIAVVLQPTSSTTEASSHREAPLISGDPLADNTDVYAFIAPDAQDKVTLVGNWIPFEEPAGGPNFFKLGDDVTYDFDIDNNGDAKSDITYRFKFHTQVVDPTTFLAATGPITSLSDPHYNIRQFYDVYRQEGHGDFVKIASNLEEPPNNIGPTSTPNYTSLAAQAIYGLPNGGKVFVGQRDDPFFADLGAIFDLATLRPLQSKPGLDFLEGFNVHSIVLQVPISDVTACHCNTSSAASLRTTSSKSLPADEDDVSRTAQPSGTARATGTAVASRTAGSTRTAAATRTAGPTMTPTTQPPTNLIIGVWSETYRQQVTVLRNNGNQDTNGPLREVSRLGNPLVNEVVIPLAQKDHFNASHPKDDAQFLPFVLNSDLASKLNAVYGLGLPTTNRTDLVTVFLTGIPGLNQPANVKGSEELRINLGIKPSDCGAPSRLGVIGGDNCGFPNGRRLTDDVTDIELRAVACGYGFAFGPCDPNASYAATTTKLTDGVDANELPFLSSFPYVATPNSGFSHVHDHSDGMTIATAGFGAAAGVLALLVAGTQAFAWVRRRRGARNIA